MTYAELRAAIQAYTENYEQDFVANIPVFVKQAEERIYNSVQFPALRRNVTGYTIAGNTYLACPNNFLASYSMAVINPATGEYEYLLNKDISFMRQMYPNPNDQGLPRYYGLYGPRYVNQNELVFMLGPTPDDAYMLELHYFFYPDSIVQTNESWLGDNFDTVLLYGSLVEAYTFMKGEPDLIKLYDEKYKEALGLAKRLGDGMDRQDVYRSSQVRLPVV
jgi:hypothetical protein